MSKESYQSVNNYNGDLYGMRPSYQGVEYDFEVPANLVVSSPGGVDSRTGHYTKGFYGRGNTSSDVYAGQGPRYISGEFGSLYESGQTATQAQGYYPAAQDYQFYQNYTPQQYIRDPISQGYEKGWTEQRIHKGAAYDGPGGSGGSSLIENYTSTGSDSFELIENPTLVTPSSITPTKITVGLLGVVIISVIALWLWANASSKAVQTIAIGDPGWKGYGLAAVMMTMIVVFGLWMRGDIWN